MKCMNPGCKDETEYDIKDMIDCGEGIYICKHCNYIMEWFDTMGNLFEMNN